MQAPQTFKKGQEVYRNEEKDSSGAPVKKKYWVCCSRYNETLEEWEHNLKDGPLPDGKTVAENINERKLRRYE